MRILEVELYIRDESGYPLGIKTEVFSAIKESDDTWSVVKKASQKNQKKGKGITRKRAVIDWFYKNIEA